MRLFCAQREEHERQHSDQHHRAINALSATENWQDKVFSRGTLLWYEYPKRRGQAKTCHSPRFRAWETGKIKKKWWKMMSMSLTSSSRQDGKIHPHLLRRSAGFLWHRRTAGDHPVWRAGAGHPGGPQDRPVPYHERYGQHPTTSSSAWYTASFSILFSFDEAVL